MFFRRLSLAILVVYSATFVAVNGFAFLVAGMRYQRPVGWLDAYATYGFEALLGLVFFVLIIVFLWAASWHWRWRWLGRLGRLSSLGALAVVMAYMVYGIVFLIVSAYVFWEWGAFLEPQHYWAARQAGYGDALKMYLLDDKALIVYGAFAVLASLGVVTYRYLGRRPRRWRRIAGVTAAGLCVLVPGAWLQDALLTRLDPSTQSPIRQFYFTRMPDNQRALEGVAQPPVYDPQALRALYRERPVPRRYEKWRGAAAGMDVILFVMESARQADVSLYGYPRHTMPFLASLARHALVFHNAYVNQPRTSKTLASLMLGIYPDPRLPALSWESWRVNNHASLARILAGEGGYTLYAGTTQEAHSDGFANFMRATMGSSLSRLVTLEDLGDKAKPDGMVADDTVLVDDFLQWYAHQDDKVFAMLWTGAAHHPYLCPYKFIRPEASVKDRYDNCLYSIDRAMEKLVRGIKRLGRDQQVLLVAFGDHGEAVGDRLDFGHGSFMYEHSFRIPFLIYQEKLFPRRIDLYPRFQVKDVGKTLFYLLGIDAPLRQSVNIFSKTEHDKIYLTNVYQDYKLGVIDHNDIKFVYRPRYRMFYAFDLASGHDETVNEIGRFSKQAVEAVQRELVTWYYSQVAYVEKEFPDPRK